jgi:hypothetical protein
VQLRIAEIPEYIPFFLYSVDGVGEKYIPNSSFQKISKLKFACKYIFILYINRDIESQDTADSQAMRIWAYGCPVIHCENLT